jgi:hypothetical protein
MTHGEFFAASSNPKVGILGLYVLLVGANIAAWICAGRHVQIPY